MRSVTSQSLGAGALLVNPWNISDMANAIYDALSMSEDERRERHRQNYMHVQVRIRIVMHMCVGLLHATCTLLPIWCARDRHHDLHVQMRGGPHAPSSCAQPILKHDSAIPSRDKPCPPTVRPITPFPWPVPGPRHGSDQMALLQI